MNEIRRLKLLLIMRQNGFTAPAVAAIVGVRPQTVRCWTSGVREVPARIFKLLREELRGRRQAA